MAQKCPELLARAVPGTIFLHGPGLSQAGLLMATACKRNRFWLMAAMGRLDRADLDAFKTLRAADDHDVSMRALPLLW